MELMHGDCLKGLETYHLLPVRIWEFLEVVQSITVLLEGANEKGWLRKGTITIELEDIGVSKRLPHLDFRQYHLPSSK